jgi:hypothetical protein
MMHEAAELWIHGRPIENVFELVGKDENSLTKALGWAMSRSTTFLSEVASLALGRRLKRGESSVRLQEYRRRGGYTDLEVEIIGHAFLIFEAKRGWNLPGRTQLAKYANRRSFAARRGRKAIVVLSECTREFADRYMDAPRGLERLVVPLRWHDVIRTAERVAARLGSTQKGTLRDLATYLRGHVTMRNLDSNWAYVVSLAAGMPEGWAISWIDIVRKRRRYFHPVGRAGWPKEPPNYLAFRYSGKLQSVHFVKDYQVVKDLHDACPEIPRTPVDPHYVYALGAPLRPAHDVRTGNIFRNGRVRCMIDTLFDPTITTISQARDVSGARSKSNA